MFKPIILKLGCSLMWWALFLNSIDFKYSYPAPCSFWTWHIWDITLLASNITLLASSSLCFWSNYLFPATAHQLFHWVYWTAICCTLCTCERAVLFVCVFVDLLLNLFIYLFNIYLFIYWILFLFLDCGILVTLCRGGRCLLVDVYCCGGPCSYILLFKHIDWCTGKKN